MALQSPEPSIERIRVFVWQPPGAVPTEGEAAAVELFPDSREARVPCVGFRCDVDGVFGPSALVDAIWVALSVFRCSRNEKVENKSGRGDSREQF